MENEKERLKREYKILIVDEISTNDTSGITIYAGRYRGQLVAVKRIPRMLPGALREIEAYRRFDNKSSNIVKSLFDSTEKDMNYDYHYLVLERARCSLFELILARKYRSVEHMNETRKSFLRMTRCQLWERHDGSPSPTLLGIIKDVIDSLTCLQEHGVLHHNITPHNILIFSNGNGEELCAKLADFSLCSLLSDDPLPTNMAQRSNPRLTDLEPNMEAVDIIESLLHRNPIRRPDLSLISSHPFFWDRVKKAQLLGETSNKVSGRMPYDEQNYLIGLEWRLYVNEWRSSFPEALMERMELEANYDPFRAKDLIRMARNLFQHYGQYWDIIGCRSTEEVYDFIIYYFPNLTMVAYSLAKTYWIADDNFKPFLSR